MAGTRQVTSITGANTDSCLALLEHNNSRYEEFLNILGQGDRFAPETVLQFIRQIAGFAFHYHPGRFADGALENPALRIGQELDRHDKCVQGRSTLHEVNGRRHILHVATTVFAVGGHTRIIRHWTNLDTDSRHSLVLTEQEEHPVPDWLSQTIRRSGGNVVVLLRIFDRRRQG